MPVAAAKLRGLREGVRRDGKVIFKTGAEVRIECRYVVKTPVGAICVFTERELSRAYELAMRPPGPIPAPLRPDLDQKWGVDPPW